MGVRSDRKLIMELQCNMALRWFMRLDISSKIWDDSSFSKNPLSEEYVSQNRDVGGILLANFARPPLVGIDAHWYSPEVDWTDTTRRVNSATIRDIASVAQQEKRVSVIIWARWSMYLSEAFLDENRNVEGSVAVLGRSLRTTVSRLRRSGVYRVMIVMPYPELNSDIARCLSVRGEKSCRTEKRGFKARMEKTAIAL